MRPTCLLALAALGLVGCNGKSAEQRREHDQTVEYHLKGDWFGTFKYTSEAASRLNERLIEESNGTYSYGVQERISVPQFVLRFDDKGTCELTNRNGTPLCEDKAKWALSGDNKTLNLDMSPEFAASMSDVYGTSMKGRTSLTLEYSRDKQALSQELVEGVSIGLVRIGATSASMSFYFYTSEGNSFFKPARQTKQLDFVGTWGALYEWPDGSFERLVGEVGEEEAKRRRAEHVRTRRRIVLREDMTATAIVGDTIAEGTWSYDGHLAWFTPLDWRPYHEGEPAPAPAYPVLRLVLDESMRKIGVTDPMYDAVLGLVIPQQPTTDAP